MESHESRPSALKLANLNSELQARARRGAGLESLSDADYLLKRKLAYRRGSELVRRQAAELLFARPPVAGLIGTDLQWRWGGSQRSAALPR